MSFPPQRNKLKSSLSASNLDGRRKKPGAVSFSTNAAADDDSSSVSYTAGTYGDGELGIAGLTAQITELIKENTSLVREVESLQQKTTKYEQQMAEKDQTIEQFAAGLRENMEMLEQLEEIEEEAKRMTRQQERQKTKEVKSKLKTAMQEKAQIKTELAVAQDKIKELEDRLALASAAAATGATTTALAVANNSGIPSDNGDKDREKDAALAAAKAAQMAQFVKEMQAVSDLLLQKIAHYSGSNGTSTSTALITTTTNGNKSSPTSPNLLPAIDERASSVYVTSTDLAVTPPRDGEGRRRSRASITGFAKLRRGVRKITMINHMTKQRFSNWSYTLKRIDPRYQILEFFDEIAEKGASALNDCNVHLTGECTVRCLDKDIGKEKISDIDFEQSMYFDNESEALLANSVFNKAGVFTVWRPTSLDSIRKMIVGDGVGKGLDIKGKSAKKGQFSGFVPFLQLHEERHKTMTRSIPVDARMRVFYNTKEMRDKAHNSLLMVAVEMLAEYTKSRKTIDKIKEREATAEADGEEIDKEEAAENDRLLQEALDKWMWDMEDPVMHIIDEYAPQKYGIDLPQRLFFEAYVIRGDVSRPKGSIHETGRLSEPAFQDMNNETLRKIVGKGAPRPVVLLKTDNLEFAMDPRYLLIAYEDLGTVKPVVSDFDCFLVGTRRINFEKKLPDEQVKMVKWCLGMIEKILALPPSNESWTMRWLEGLKEEYEKGFHVAFPKYGFADPKSYSIMGHAVQRLSGSGSVRHGAECFNYYFPQELDEEFLVVTRNQPSGPWQKFSRDGLLKFLSQKIDEGFMFPVNPKWILCDGWKDLYDKQMMSDNETTRKAVNAWYPPGSGIREMIEGIAARYPQGFRKFAGPYKMENKIYSPLRYAQEAGEEMDACEAMDVAEMEVQHDRVLRKAIKAVNAVLFANRMSRVSLNINQQIDLEEEEEKAIKAEKAQKKHATAVKERPAAPAKKKPAKPVKKRPAKPVKGKQKLSAADQRFIADSDNSNGDLRDSDSDIEYPDMNVKPPSKFEEEKPAPAFKPTSLIQDKRTSIQPTSFVPTQKRPSQKAQFMEHSGGTYRDDHDDASEDDIFGDASSEASLDIVPFAGRTTVATNANGLVVKGILKSKGPPADIFADADDDDAYV